MTAPALADHGLLSALAITYGAAGHDRGSRLTHASAHVGRFLASTAELTVEEARALRRHVPRCAPSTCTVVVPATRTCGCSVGGSAGHPTACDPRGVGRYCPPSLCWCGSCPWWKPAAPVNYAAALQRLAEQTRSPR
ncbi:hypothetical protein [Blastococcus sp. CCUG 61487]|uniref:hypothetical protein n=1 Tax=Blastococcus sp. CCUG 61487 TaxID=1840703 RepID=UPI0010C0B4FD|nr:hypothetical protein [Blastococcus sp. CCUG 61487]